MIGYILLTVWALVGAVGAILFAMSETKESGAVTLGFALICLGLAVLWPFIALLIVPQILWAKTENARWAIGDGFWSLSDGATQMFDRLMNITIWTR